jgi:hypothetical protein
MPLRPEILSVLTKSSAGDAWRAIIESITAIASAPLGTVNASSEVIKRDREIGAFDNFISASGWDLWRSFADSVERTSDRLARWWAEPYGGKAVLVLDGLSLRELPWLLQGVQERGFKLHELSVNASELPGETNEFARALGFGSRSQLQNNGGGRRHRLQPAQTESIDMPWKDCEGLVNSAPNWVFWHHWPDSRIHNVAVAGQGLDTLTSEAVEQLNSADFWSFVARLATGRRLVITSDHGYAAAGYFPDADGDVGQYLKKTFSSARSVAGGGESGPFVPPVALQLDSPHGCHLMALGRRKWKSPGGYPTLTHGGLSLLEVLSPFVEISK